MLEELARLIFVSSFERAQPRAGERGRFAGVLFEVETVLAERIFVTTQAAERVGNSEPGSVGRWIALEDALEVFGNLVEGGAGPVVDLRSPQPGRGRFRVGLDPAIDGIERGAKAKRVDEDAGESFFEIGVRGGSAFAGSQQERLGFLVPPRSGKYDSDRSFKVGFRVAEGLGLIEGGKGFLGLLLSEQQSASHGKGEGILGIALHPLIELF
jgi:hypothetical protein